MPTLPAAGGWELSTLCAPPGTRKQVPLVVHSKEGILFEEPLFACLTVTIERLEGMAMETASSSGVFGGACAGASPQSTPRSSSSAAGGGGGGLLPSGSPRVPIAAAAGKLARFFRRRRGGDGRRGSRDVDGLGRSSFTFGGSEDSSMMLAGEDAGDECELCAVDLRVNICFSGAVAAGWACCQRVPVADCLHAPPYPCPCR